MAGIKILRFKEVGGTMKRWILTLALAVVTLGLAGCSPADEAFIQAKIDQLSWPATDIQETFSLTVNEDGESLGYKFSLRGKITTEGMSLLLQGDSTYPYWPSLGPISVYADAEGYTYVGKSGLLQLLDLWGEYSLAEALTALEGDYLYFDPQGVAEMEGFSGTYTNYTWQQAIPEALLQVLTETFSGVDIGFTRSGDTFRLTLDQDSAAEILDALFTALLNNYEAIIAALPLEELDEELIAELRAETPAIKQAIASLQSELVALLRETPCTFTWESTNQASAYTDRTSFRINFSDYDYDGNEYRTTVSADAYLAGAKTNSGSILFPQRTIDGFAWLNTYYDYDYAYDNYGDTELATISLIDHTITSEMGTWPMDARLIDGSVYVPLIDISALLFERVYWDAEAGVPYIVYYGDDRIELTGLWIGSAYYIKLRVLEDFEYYLTWDGDQQEVLIEY
jgi:hypothetical protein